MRGIIALFFYVFRSNLKYLCTWSNKQKPYKQDKIVYHFLDIYIIKR